MKAVIYARYSSDNQREESIEGQLRDCTAFAEKNGFTVLHHYIDRAYSAKTDNRPEFQNMIRDSAKKLFDVIIVWKLDRFARNRYDSARYKNALKKNGVKVVSATEVISDGPDGIILESVLEGFAEYYSAELSEKVVRGMTDNVLKGKFNGGPIPMGYTIDAERHYQIDPVKAPFVVEIFELYDAGRTMKEIVDQMTEQGLLAVNGKPLTYNTIRKMLHNRRYIGEYSFRDTVLPDGVPAIVPRDLFDRVQDRLEKNKRAPARFKATEEYLLTTKLICGYCGAMMCGESGIGRHGVVYHYYKCATAKKRKGGCHKKSVRKQEIENAVVCWLLRRIQSDEAVEALVSSVMSLQESENTTIPVLEQHLRETEAGIRNMLNAIQQGVLTKSTKARLEELEAARDRLELEISQEKLEKPALSAEFVRCWIERFRKLDPRIPSHRRTLIDNFLNVAILFDDKIVLGINFKEGTETISLADLKEAEESFLAPGSDMEKCASPRRRRSLRTAQKKQSLSAAVFSSTVLRVSSFSPPKLASAGSPFRDPSARLRKGLPLCETAP